MPYPSINSRYVPLYIGGGIVVLLILTALVLANSSTYGSLRTFFFLPLASSGGQVSFGLPANQYQQFPQSGAATSFGTSGQQCWYNPCKNATGPCAQVIYPKDCDDPNCNQGPCVSPRPQPSPIVSPRPSQSPSPIGSTQQGAAFPANAQIIDMTGQVQILSGYTVTPQQTQIYRGDPVVVDFTALQHPNNTDYIGIAKPPITSPPVSSVRANGTNGTVYITGTNRSAGDYEVRYYKKIGPNTYGVEARVPITLISDYRAALVKYAGPGTGAYIPVSGQLTINTGQTAHGRTNLPEPRPSGTFIMQLYEPATNASVWTKYFSSTSVSEFASVRMNHVGTYQWRLLKQANQTVEVMATSANLVVE